MVIQFFHREKGLVEVEKVYGDKAVEWLYNSFTGKLFSRLAIKRFFSSIYGIYQNSGISQRKIKPFVDNFQIDLTEYLPEKLPEQTSGADAAQGSSHQISPYSSFNAFFIRKFKAEARAFTQVRGEMPAFAEARYFGHKEINPELTIPVKGEFLTVNRLLSDERWSPLFQGGPILVARLCPVDYHRFHFPDTGRILDHYRIPGVFHSVNPLALKKKNDIFITNERHVTILDTVNFGKIAYIEIGAMCVGRIVQTHDEKVFNRGDEKGYFLFGASTVIIVGQKGAWQPMPDIVENTQRSLETYIKLGDRVASKN